jgi:hypothetical protein
MIVVDAGPFSGRCKPTNTARSGNYPVAPNPARIITRRTGATE